MIANPETVSESFINYLEAQGYGTWGTSLFLGKVPQDAPDTCYWVITSGGDPIQKLRSGETVKQYFVAVNFRSTKSKDVERNLFKLEELLNCESCVDLQGFEVLEIEASGFPVDTDLDNEERDTGFVQANIKTYKKEC